MTEIEQLQALLREDELAHYDLGSVKIVRPTGRYTDASENGEPDYFDPRVRFIVEVKEPGFFGNVRWLPAKNLKRVHGIGGK